MKKYILMSLLVLAGCKNKTMQEQNNFSYDMSVSAPKEYPVEIHEGVLSHNKTFISAFINTGTIENGWGFPTSSAGMGGGIIPNHLELTWISYAEKKFWTVDTPLPEDKILELFRKGYDYTRDEEKEKGIIHETYSGLIIGLAPGGVVVVWLDGATRTEVGRFQGKEIYVNKLDFQPVKQPDESQEQFFDDWFKLAVPKETQAEILENGIPLGEWDNYRKTYPWRFRTISFRAGAEEKLRYQTTNFMNGEFIMYDTPTKEKMLKEFTQKPLPWRVDFGYQDNYSSNPTFNKQELMAAFETLSEKHPNEPIEIVGKIGFEYRSLKFKVVCKEDEIPLEKVAVIMYDGGTVISK